MTISPWGFILLTVLFVVGFAALVAFFLALILRSEWLVRRFPGAFRAEVRDDTVSQPPPGDHP